MFCKVFLFSFYQRTKSDLVQRRERRVSINGTKSYKNDAKRLNSTSNNGATYNDNKAQLLSQLPPSTKVETILKTEPLDPEVQNHASGSQSYISSGSGEVGTEFFNDIEAPGSVSMPGAGAIHALEDDDFLLNSIQPVGGSQGYHQTSHASHNNIKKEVDIYNEYQVCLHKQNENFHALDRKENYYEKAYYNFNKDKY